MRSFASYYLVNEKFIAVLADKKPGIAFTNECNLDTWVAFFSKVFYFKAVNTHSEIKNEQLCYFEANDLQTEYDSTGRLVLKRTVFLRWRVR